MGIVHAKSPNIPKNYGVSPTDVHSTSGGNPPKSNKINDNDTHADMYDNPMGESNFMNLHQSVRVDKIHIDGLMRTKDDIVKAQVIELFNTKDFRQMLHKAQHVKTKLETLGCFKKVGIYIDMSRGPDATPDGVEVTFNVNEMSRFSGGINTMVGNNEGSLLIQAKAPNIFGRGERLQMDYSYGSKSTTNINISAVKPFVNNWLHKIFTASVFNTTTDVPWSGYKETNHGILLDLAIIPGTLKQNFQYEVGYRNIIAARQASFKVREQCGPNLKSVLRHICSIDKRDDTIFPTSGNLIQFTSELAGLGGDIGYMKYELMLQSNWTPHKFLSFQLGAQAGFLSEISNDMHINIADNFFLGGPMNLRGFVRRGCGPHDENNAIGGNAFWSAALHLYTPLPFRPGKNSFGDLFRLHGFINGGNLANLKSNLSDDDYAECIKMFTDNVRLSAGGGIAMKIGGMARIELNLIIPLLMVKGDITEQYQFGIGINYL